MTQLQTNNKTFLGRYWAEHSLLRRYTPSDAGIRVLSFGCSTGEELLGLRALFPAAMLFGCDIDWQNLQMARAQLGSAAVIFESTWSQLTAHGPFDVIVCNSVLLQPTQTAANGQKSAIPSSLWLDAVAQLDAVLKPGGLLQIVNSNIPLRYHPCAASYTPLRSALILGPNFVDQFDIDGQHLCTGVGGGGWSPLTHRHLGEAGWRDVQPTDLHDVHFRKRGGVVDDSPIDDERLTTLTPGMPVASGTQTYRPAIDPNEARPSTHIEVDVHWTTNGVDSVRLKRHARRVWFDGSVAWCGTSAIDLTGASASVFIESALGRRSTRVAMEDLLAPKALRSAAF